MDSLILWSEMRRMSKSDGWRALNGLCHTGFAHFVSQIMQSEQIGWLAGHEWPRGVARDSE